MLRSILAVAAGFLVTVLLAVGSDYLLMAAMPGAFSPDGRVERTSLLLFALAYGALFAVAGAYVTGRLAPGRPVTHALILGAIALALSIVVSASRWDNAPAWYNLAALAVILPAAWAGGTLAMRHRPGDATPPRAGGYPGAA
ncbi:MAG TPA: hypothetical protein VNA89_11765 [Gemmatimonadaceae bacterium]|nr:hypothetical protein [Gemmatimonadaceae bacterium]